MDNLSFENSKIKKQKPLKYYVVTTVEIYVLQWYISTMAVTTAVYTTALYTIRFVVGVTDFITLRYEITRLYQQHVLVHEN